MIVKNPNYNSYSVCITVSLALFLVLTPRLQARSGDAFLDRFQGTWQGDGKSFGRPASLHMTWEWVLEGKFLRLSLKSESKSAAGEIQAFEGHAYYQAAGDGKYEGKWFDSRGESFPINGSAEGASLIALWGAPGKEQGKSVYRFLDAAKLEVVDSVKQTNGTWKEFGRFVVVRK